MNVNAQMIQEIPASIPPEEHEAFLHAKNVIFPMLKRLKKISDEIFKRLDAGEKLEDIHADMRERKK